MASSSGVPAAISPRDVIGAGRCIGCGTCAAHARSVGAGDPGSSSSLPAMELDRFGLLVPAGDRAWLRKPSVHLAETCPFSPAAADEDDLAGELVPDAPSAHPATGRMLAGYVGHVRESDFRGVGSSGGMVSWVLAELFRQDLIDGAAHVVPSRDEGDRFFRYRISRTLDEVRSGARSRYYPVEMSAVLEEIRTRPGRYAVVGVPCFIKAVQLLRRSDPVLRERVVFTLGLFCGHMKSARFVESFAWQMDVAVEDVTAVEFRVKDPSRPASTYTTELQLADGATVRRDWWNLADGDWGAGFFQSSACNSCDDVVAETADISFGDAWVEPYSSDGNGTNVVVVRTAVLHDLVGAAIADGRVQLTPVDGAFIQETQAAGLRQRREGLAYRLTWRHRGFALDKRVEPSRRLPVRRKLIYRTRHGVSAWSHRVFWLARTCHRPQVYVGWARTVGALYHALAYSRGRMGALLDRVLPRP
jgi:coenzyme F420-reducing hydrogenase beta subunit